MCGRRQSVIGIFPTVWQLSKIDHDIGDKCIPVILPLTDAVSLAHNFFDDGQTQSMVECVGLCGRMVKDHSRIFGVFHMDKEKIILVVDGKSQKGGRLTGGLTAFNTIVKQIEKEADKGGSRNPDFLREKNITGKSDAEIVTFRSFP